MVSRTGNRNAIRGVSSVLSSGGKAASKSAQAGIALSQEPLQKSLEHITNISKVVQGSPIGIGRTISSPLQKILQDLDPLYKARAVSTIAAEASSFLSSFSASPLQAAMKGVGLREQAEVVSLTPSVTLAASGASASLMETALKGLTPYEAKPLSSAIFGTVDTLGSLSSSLKSDALDSLSSTLNSYALQDSALSLSPLKTVTAMAHDASLAMFAASTNPILSAARGFKAASTATQVSGRGRRRPLPKSLDSTLRTIEKLKSIQDSIVEIPLTDRIPAFGHVDFSEYVKRARPAFMGGFSAEAVQEAALDMAASISESAVTADAEKLFPKEEIDSVLPAIRETLATAASQRPLDTPKEVANSRAFAFMLNVVAGIVTYYVVLYSTQIKEEWSIHHRSLPAIDYVMYSKDKPQMGIIRKNGGARVYAKPDKRSDLVHSFMDGEFVALMWNQKPGWRKVAYEVDPVTMQALKVGWIQESDYDRTNMPVKSLFLRLYKEQSEPKI